MNSYFNRLIVKILCSCLIFVLVFGVLARGTSETNAPSEWDDAKIVIVHVPGPAAFYNSLFPIGHGITTPFSQSKARNEMGILIDSLSHLGVLVITAEKAILAGTIDSDGYPIDGQKLYTLQHFAKKSLSFDFSKLKYPLVVNLETYKSQIIAGLSPQNIFKLLMINPTLYISNSNGKMTTNNDVNVEFKVTPLFDFMYLGDYAITTKSGIIAGRAEITVQGKKEDELLRYLMKSLNVDFICNLGEGAKLHGGDFFPAGNVCFIGQGQMTNSVAIRQMLNEDVFGTEYVVVVKDELAKNSQKYLSKYFNFLNHNTVVLGENRINGKEAILADVYEKDDNDEGYKIIKRNTNFAKYLKKNFKYTIVPVSMDDQLADATDFFLVKENVIIGANGVSHEYKKALNDAGVSAVWLDLDNIKAGYGGVHSVIQVINREKPKKNKSGMSQMGTISTNNDKGYMNL